jgi:hypothetical protein
MSGMTVTSSASFFSSMVILASDERPPPGEQLGRLVVRRVDHLASKLPRVTRPARIPIVPIGDDDSAIPPPLARLE